MPIKKLYIVATLLLSTTFSYAQDLQQELDELDKELDAIFADEDDSLSLISLIDEILSIDNNYSEIQFRVGYSSRVTSAGRDFGIDQQGITPGISFYHKSGLFMDATGFWNSEFDPKYNLTVATLGYIKQFGKRYDWSYSFTYDHSFYTESDTLNTLTNALSGSITKDFKKIYTGFDYSFSFGSETAHRLVWNITGNLNIKGFGPFRKITLLPSIAFLMANQNIVSAYFDQDRFEEIQNLTNRQIDQLRRNGTYTQEQIFQLLAIRRLTNADELTPQQETFINNFFTSESTSETFSWINTYIAIPVILYTKKLNFFLSYNYNIPRNQEGAEYEYESNGYFGFGIAYNLRVQNKK